MSAGRSCTACFRYAGTLKLLAYLTLKAVQEDDVDVLHITAAVLLFDGRANEAAFEMMQTEGAFPRLVELVRDKPDDDSGLHRLLLELMFEMSRMQRLSKEDISESACAYSSSQSLIWSQ